MSLADLLSKKKKALAEKNLKKRAEISDCIWRKRKYCKLEKRTSM